MNTLHCSDDDDNKEVRGEDGARGVHRLPKFANFEPSPDDSKPDGTKALAGKSTRDEIRADSDLHVT